MYHLLQTHNVALASPLADFVISLRDGHVISQGSVTDALSEDQQLAEEYKHEEEAIELDEHEQIESVQAHDLAGAVADAKDGKLVVAEEIAVGHVSGKACTSSPHIPTSTLPLTHDRYPVKLFLLGLGGITFWFQYLFGQSMMELFGILQVWWLGYWARQYTLRDSSDVNVGL